MKEFFKNLTHYIDQYDFEIGLFELGNKIKLRGFLSQKEFMWICLWKSRRPKKLYLQNDELKIRELTQLALSEPDEVKKMEYLCKLDGVQIPTASAILCVLSPDKYPIIDVRCVQTLKSLGFIDWDSITVDHWIKYLEIIRKLAKEHYVSPREFEKALFAYNRIELDEDYRNLYSKN